MQARVNQIPLLIIRKQYNKLDWVPASACRLDSRLLDLRSRLASALLVDTVRSDI